MNKIEFEYVERHDEDTDVIYIFIDHALIQECVYVDPDEQYYRLFDHLDNCIKHYENHRTFEKNIEKDIKKLYKME